MSVDRDSNSAPSQSSHTKEWKNRIMGCHEKTLEAAIQIAAIGNLLRKNFEANSDETLYGLGLTLESFGNDLSKVYCELEQIASRF